MKRTPLVRAAAPLGAVLTMSALAGLIITVAALAFLQGWHDPDASRLSHSLGGLYRPVAIGAWTLLGWALLVVAFELLKAHGTVALLYGLQRDDDVLIGSWLGSWGLGRRRLECETDVALIFREEPSLNPKGLVHHTVLVRAGGRSFTARSVAPPTQESIAEATRWLAGHDLSVTTEGPPHRPAA